ncbi:hypothetical protein O0L34_g10835 [Tuta absoluta]|nr:hypothetical protein O0L34_g10835 [Tuta absoluta]
MAPLSLKIILENGAVTRTVMFDSSAKVSDASAAIREKVLNADDGKEYALFLTSADDDKSGIWLEANRPLDYYMLRNGDSLLYLHKQRNLRVKMLDGTVKTLQVDESKNIGELMMVICNKIGITNHDEYGLCQEEPMDQEESKENRPTTGTLTLRKRKQERERDAKMDELSKKLKTDDNVDWLDQHKTLRETGVELNETVLLKRRLFYSDRNVDSRDPVQLNLLYVQTRDAILNGRHPVTEDQGKS